MSLAIIHNQKKYAIRFSYASSRFKTLRNIGNIHKQRVVTECTISIKNDNEPNHIIIGSGKAVKNRLDKFNKKEGRKIALTRATWSIGDKDLRTKIWTRYKDICKL